MGTDAQNILLQEGFENDSIPGWTMIDFDGDGQNWFLLKNSQSPTGGFVVHSGEGHITSASYASGIGALYPDNWLITPAVNLTADAMLTFWVAGQDQSWAAEHFSVYLSTTGHAITDFTTTLLYDQVATGTMTEYTVNLAQYTGQTVYIAFRHHNVSDMYRLNLDDVEITTAPSEPTISVVPASITLNAYLGGTAAAMATVNTFHLTSGVSATTSYPFAVSTDNVNFNTSVTLPQSGGTLYVQYQSSSVGIDNGSVLLSSAGATDVTLDLIGQTVALATLPYSQDFEESDENANWSFFHNGANEWVIGSAANNTDDGANALYISNDNGVSNSYDLTSTTTAWAWRDINFGVSEEYSLSFDFRSVGESSINDYLKVYVGPPAEVQSTASSTGSNIPGALLIGTFYGQSDWTHFSTTLNNNFYGIQRLYFLWWNDDIGGTNPPAAIDNIVITSTNCNKPSTPVASNITAHTANITFTPAQSTDNSWEYALCTGTETADSVTPEAITTTTILLTDLDDGTDYRLYVRTVCDDGEYSYWSNVCNFSTTATCTSPQNLSVSNIASSSAMVSWDPALIGATGYTFAYREMGQGNWTYITPTDNMVLLSGLDPETTYEVSVTTICDEGSAPAAMLVFSTFCLGFTESQIGTGNATSTYIPSNSFYNYGYSQQLFKADEMDGPATISSISLDMASVVQQRNYSIYLTHTTANDLAISWADTVGIQEVFSGAQTLVQGWNTFVFSNPFEYNGVDNLLLVILDNTGSYVNGNSWHVHEAFNGSARYACRDAASFGLFPEAGVSGTSLNVRNNIKFGTCDSASNECAAPNVFADVINANDITIVWVPGYQETEWELEYKMHYSPTWISLGTVTSSPYTINNLTPNTMYDIRLGTICDTGMLWSTISVSTNCAMMAIPFFEDFDSYAANAGSRPICWSFPVTYTNAPYIIASQYYSAPNSLFFVSQTTNPTTAVTPPLGAEIQDLRVRFMLKAESTTYSGTFEVGVMSDPNNMYTFESVTTIQPENNGWNLYTVDFNNVNLSGTNRHIAFRQHPVSSAYYYWLDDVDIIYIPDCLEPTNLTAQNPTTNSVELSWNSPDTNFNLYYKTVYDTSWTVVNNVSLTNGVYTLTGLMPSTTYHWRVSHPCDDGSESMSSSSVFHTVMAAANLPYSTDFNYGSDLNWQLNNGSCYNIWTIGMADTANALFITHDVTTPGYDNHMSVVSAEKLFNIGTDPEFLISFDVLSGGESNCDYLKVFFAPATSEYPASNSTPDYAISSYSTNAVDFTNYLSSTGEQSYPFKLNLTNGTLHVEVVMPNPNATPSAASTAKLVFLWRNDASLSTAQPGAVIYNVSVASLNCPDPTNLTVSNVTNSTADLVWTPGGSESAWTVEYKESDATAWISTTTNAPSYQLTGLSALTVYDVRVKADCGVGSASDWTSTVTFTTLPDDTPDTCDVPTGLHTTEVLNEAISITWDANASVSSWNIQYRVLGESAFSSATATTNSYTISGLAALTTYEIQVQANCGDENLSDWSDFLTIQTHNDGIISWLSNSVVLFPNPAREYVDVRIDGDVNVTLMEVYDVYGKVVHTSVGANNYSPLQTTRINVSGLADGMYFVRVTTDMGTVTKSFVKN
jgi:hypothetical protein